MSPSVCAIAAAGDPNGIADAGKAGMAAKAQTAAPSSTRRFMENSP